MTFKFTPNHAGIGAILKSAEVRALVEEKTNEVAKIVRDMGIKVGDRDGGRHEYDMPVKAKVSTTDRAHGSVTITHPAGIAVQAKHGALTKAASAAGLHVR